MKTIVLKKATEVGDNEMVDMAAGTVIIGSRFFVNARPLEKDAELEYEVYAEIPAAEFFAAMDYSLRPISADYMSDMMVKAFDCGLAQDFAEKYGYDDNLNYRNRGCMYFFKTADGKLVEQHST